MDGLFCIFKLIKACEEKDFGGGKLRLNTFCQLHAVHIRHFDIRQNHIRLKLLHHFQRLDTIVGKSDDGEAQSLPINFPSDGLDDLFLIVRQKHRICIHIYSPYACIRAPHFSLL